MPEILTEPVTPNRTESATAAILKWCGIVLVTTVWVSALLFGLYILAFYASAIYQGNAARWNNMLPGLYSKNSGTANTGIGLHFAAGGIILILGSLQLIESIRVKFPAVHRWVGRVYVIACLFAAAGGLIFIFIKGTIGGQVMNIGFALYGILMFIAALQTYRHAITRRFEKHRAWALRLYALAIGSWLYRMDYGFWLLLTDGYAHTKTFSGIFDHVMAFFFYLPNLLVAEVFIRAKKYNAHPAVRIAASLVLLLATGFLLLGTYFFTLYYWGPAILKWMGI
jgi:hypothetical protein